MRLAFLLFAFLYNATPCLAGTVSYCEEGPLNGKAKKRPLLCWLTLAEGQIGQSVEIKDHQNYIVARAKIVKRQGSIALVVISKLYKDVRVKPFSETVEPGFTAILKIDDNDTIWTATTSPY